MILLANRRRGSRPGSLDRVPPSLPGSAASRGSSPAPGELRGLGRLVLLAIPLVLVGLGSYGLVNGDEGVYHGIAVEMLESGSWLRLELLGEPRTYDTFMNAPLQYWARALLIALFGSSFWTMRLLSALFAVASVLLSYRFVRRFAGRRAARLAGIVQLTTFQFLYLHSARTGELEPILCFLFTAIAWTFMRAVLEERSWIPHHLCLALLVAVKAPVVLVPLLAEAGCFAALSITRPHLRGYVRAACRVLPLGCLWHVGQMVACWEEFVGVAATMGSEVRAAGEAGFRTDAMPGVEAGPLRTVGFHVWVLLFGAFPYALVYPPAFLSGLRAGETARERLPWQVMGFLVLAVFLFYSVVAKHHPWYVLPAVPLLSAFVGRWLAELESRPREWWLAPFVALVIALVLWLDVGDLSLNPFATRAYRIPMDTTWRVPPVGTPWLAVAVTTAAAALVVLALGRMSTGKRRLSPARVLMVCLLGYAALRVGAPLRHLGYRSETARFHAGLSEREAGGEPLDYPVASPVPYTWETPYYFARDHEIVLHADLSYELLPRERPPGEHEGEL